MRKILSVILVSLLLISPSIANADQVYFGENSKSFSGKYNSSTNDALWVMLSPSVPIKDLAKLRIEISYSTDTAGNLTLSHQVEDKYGYTSASSGLGYDKTVSKNESGNIIIQGSQLTSDFSGQNVFINGISVNYGTSNNTVTHSGNYTMRVYYDATPPTSPTISLPDGWVSSAALSLSGSIVSSGNPSYEYSVDRGAWNVLTGVFNFSTITGTFDIQARAKDNFGIYSPIVSKTLYIDNTKPEAPDISFIPSKWINYDYSGTISGKGVGPSGLSLLRWQIGSGSWVNSSKVIVSSEGYNYLYFNSISNTGIVGKTSGITVKIDKTPPPAPTIKIK